MHTKSFGRTMKDVGKIFSAHILYKICAQSEFIADWNKHLKYERQHPSPTAARSQEWRTHACNVALYHEIKTRYGLAYTFLMEHSVPMYCAPTLWMSKCGGGVGPTSLMQIFYTFSPRKPKKSGAQIKICAQATKVPGHSFFAEMIGP